MILRLFFHMERVEWVRCHVPESQSMVGGMKSAWGGPVVGGGLRLIVDCIATCGTQMITLDHNGCSNFSLLT